MSDGRWAMNNYEDWKLNVDHHFLLSIPSPSLSILFSIFNLFSYWILIFKQSFFVRVDGMHSFPSISLPSHCVAVESTHPTSWSWERWIRNTESHIHSYNARLPAPSTYAEFIKFFLLSHLSLENDYLSIFNYTILSSAIILIWRTVSIHMYDVCYVVRVSNMFESH